MNQPPLPGPAALDGSSVDALLQDTTPWLSCEECFERMDAYVEAAVHRSPQQDEAMATHLRACAACHEEAQSLVDLLRGL
ncbi:hypothetical protein GCM10009740_32030 [Terrabacter terrae]|uniref:Zinc-finger domain-containing protein n=1 Tax=Terrabacter terrae TaxID=318434 RepID=A0ABN2UJQ4_9MICO